VVAAGQFCYLQVKRFFQGCWLTPNVYTVPLGRCDVDWHVERGIVAVACVGQDTIKVWPLPVEQPWWEDDLENSTTGETVLIRMRHVETSR
jgi:hypothetical protein